MADYSQFLKTSDKKRKECQESCAEFVFGMGESRVMCRWFSIKAKTGSKLQRQFYFDIIHFTSQFCSTNWIEKNKKGAFTMEKGKLSKHGIRQPAPWRFLPAKGLKLVATFWFSCFNIDDRIRWTSSLWKLLWRELLVYTLSFLAISALYRVGLSTEQQLLMEKLIR